MTFQDEVTRTLFHQLPAHTQVTYADMEHRLAQCGHLLHIDSVLADENVLEVIVRVTTHGYRGASGANGAERKFP